MIKIKPATYRDESGAEKPFVIRDPVTKRLVPAEGLDVSETDFFWDRLRRDGDVVLVQGTVVDPAPSLRKPIAAVVLPSDTAAKD